MATNESALRRILFVDDEPAILAGLERVLRPLRHEIKSEFASSGAEALACLEREPFDVVITDIRMPVMDGSVLLETIQRLHPHIIRIALSGHADISVAMRTVPVAHQFLAKPCDAKMLRNVILRAVGLQNLLNDRSLQALAAGMPDLPARPKTYAVLSQQLADPTTKSSAIAEVISRDVGMAANLLKIVNSAFFGLPRRVSSIEAAVNYLGTSMLRSVVLSKAAATELGPRAAKRGYDLELNEAHALLSANLAMQLFSDKQAREDAFMAALLHNIGELLLVAAGPASALAAMELARQGDLALDDAERALGVVSHAHLGAYLLGAWGLPPSIVEAVAHHHDPRAIEHEGLELVDAVHAAALVADHYVWRRPEGQEAARAHLEALGASDGFAKVVAFAERWRGEEKQEAGA
jgi:HD-like signal output (HDOD) protein